MIGPAPVRGPRASGAIAAPAGPGGPQRRSPGLSFAVINGSFLAMELLLAVAAKGFMGFRLFGAVTVGVVLFPVQGLVLLLSALRYDRLAGAGRGTDEWGQQ